MQNPLKNRYVAYTFSKPFWFDVLRIIWFCVNVLPVSILTMIGFIPGYIFWPIYEGFMGGREHWKDWGDSVSKLSGPR